MEEKKKKKLTFNRRAIIFSPRSDLSHHICNYTSKKTSHIIIESHHNNL